MADRIEQLVGTLFRILTEEGYTAAQGAFLDAYQSKATVDRDQLSENLFAELVGVLDTHLETREQVDVLVTAVEQLLDRFTSVIETVPVGVLVVDADGRIQLWNTGAERIFGWSEDEMGDRSYPSALSASPDVTGSFLTRLREGDQLDGIETRHVHKDGLILDVRIWAAPFHTKDGTFNGGAFVISDITERKQREQRLAVLNRVLRHNVRNDVTVIQGHLELVADELPEDSKHVAVIEERLANISDLSDVARHSEQLCRDIDRDCGTVDIGSVVQERVDRLQRAYPEAEIHAAVQPTAPVVAHELLPYALDNVLENALEHNDSDTPRVEIEVSPAEEPENHITVSIADDGPGLPEGERNVLTVERETPLNHSSGLGLWLTRWIVRTSNGTLAVTDGPLDGTCIQIRLRSSI